MTSQAKRILSIERGSLSELCNQCSRLLDDRGKFSRPGLNGRIAGAAVRTSAMLAVLALGVAAPGVGQTASVQTAETRGATAQSVEAWRQAIVNVPRPHETCSTATYPDGQWRQVSCEATPDPSIAPRTVVRPAIVGGQLGNDLTFTAENGLIEEAEGSFDKVQGVTSEKSSGVPNAFSLQLNTNAFATKSCSTARYPMSCQGWVQFIYDSYARQAFIQYWLINYEFSCPAGWASDGGGDCVRNSHAVSTPAVTIANLSQMKLFGYIGNDWGIPYDDFVAVQIGNVLYSEDSGNPIAGARAGWQLFEFNVFGDGGSSEAVFNAGSTIQVRDSILLGTATQFACSDYGTTGESNNLILSAKSPLVVAAGPPSMVFIESNATGTTEGSCENAAIIGITQPIRF